MTNGPKGTMEASAASPTSLAVSKPFPQAMNVTAA